MPPTEIFRLLLLSSIWGGSFLFMRVASPTMGPVPLIWLRVTLAMFCLSPLLLNGQTRRALVRCPWKLLFFAVLSSVIPFCLLAYATLRLEAGMTAVINAMTPIFTMLVTLTWTQRAPTRWQLLGLLAGLSGVVVLSWDQLSFRTGGGGWAVMAALCATFCYGLATNFLKIRMKEVPFQAVTFGSMAGASLVLAPLAWWMWPTTPPPPVAWLSMTLLAIVSTALAYLLFYRLISRVSALAATSVTFLVPIFAFLWGALFLGENLTLRMLVGIVITLAGTALTLGIWPRRIAPPILHAN